MKIGFDFCGDPIDQGIKTEHVVFLAPPCGIKRRHVVMNFIRHEIGFDAVRVQTAIIRRQKVVEKRFQKFFLRYRIRHIKHLLSMSIASASGDQVFRVFPDIAAFFDIKSSPPQNDFHSHLMNPVNDLSKMGKTFRIGSPDTSHHTPSGINDEDAEF